MRRSRFSEEQIIGVLREHEAGMKPSAEGALGRADARQRRAEGSPGKKLVPPAIRFEAGRRAIADHDLSERRACRLLDVDRSSFQYERNGSDAPARSEPALVRPQGYPHRCPGAQRALSPAAPAHAEPRDRAGTASCG